MTVTRYAKVCPTLLLCTGAVLFSLVTAEVTAQTGDWSPTEAISNTTGSSYSPHMAADSQDTLHLVWYDWIDLVPHWPYIVYTSKAAGGDWMPLAYLPGKPEGDSPALVVDGGDAVHVIWAGRQNIEYARRAPDGTWGAVEEIPSSDEGLNPDVAVAPDGTVHAVWRKFAGPDDERVYHSLRTSEAGWSAPSQVYGGSSASSPMIAADADSTLHLLINTSGTDVQAFYAVRPAGGAWGAPGALPFVPQLRNVEQLASDAQGDLHLVWSKVDSSTCSLYYSGKKLGEGWSPPSTVMTGANSEVSVYAAAVTASAQGEVHVAWTSYLGERSAWYAYLSPGFGWSEPSLVDDDLVGGATCPPSPWMASRAATSPGIRGLPTTRPRAGRRASSGTRGWRAIRPPPKSSLLPGAACGPAISS